MLSDVRHFVIGRAMMCQRLFRCCPLLLALLTSFLIYALTSFYFVTFDSVDVDVSVLCKRGFSANACPQCSTITPIIPTENTSCEELLSAKNNEIHGQITSNESTTITSVANVTLVTYSKQDQRITQFISTIYNKNGRKIQRYLFMGDSTMRQKANAFLEFLLGDKAAKAPKNHSHLYTTHNVTDSRGQLIAVFEFTWNPFLLPERYNVSVSFRAIMFSMNSFRPIF